MSVLGLWSTLLWQKTHEEIVGRPFFYFSCLINKTEKKK
jgi:hypothetical protein